MSPNKKVTKEIGLRRALSVALPRAKAALLKNPPGAHWGDAGENKKPSESLPDDQEVHSVSLVLFISASTASRIKRFRLLPWLAAKSLMI